MNNATPLFNSLFKISRPANVLIAFLTIIVAAELAGGLQPLHNAILAAISAALITIGANVINDYFDIEIDKINKPQRPLAAGSIKKKTAIIYFSCTYLLAWFIAALINTVLLSIAVTFSFILIFYSYRLKRVLFWGNFTVSLTTAMAFIYGGLAVSHVQETIFPAAIAFLFHFGREILKDNEDVKGDATVNAFTFPIKYGIRNSLIIMNGVFILLVIITVIPYILDIYNLTYMLIICVGIYPVLLLVSYRSWNRRTAKTFGQMSTLLKIDMLAGLLAIYLG